MRTIKFRAISFKGVFYSKSLDKYYVSEPCRYDSGVTSLSLLFDIESERGIEDILSSTHFINTIGEQYWDRDWVKIGNIQFTGLLDKNCVEVFEGDIVKIYRTKSKFYEDIAKIEFYHGAFVVASVDFEDDRHEPLPKNEWQSIEVIGNIFQNEELLNDSK